jgi:hypothetical protein
LYIFKPNNPNLGKFLQRKMLLYFTYVPSVDFTVIWYILLPFGILSGYLVYVFFPSWYVLARKIWQPCIRADPLSADQNLPLELSAKLCSLIFFPLSTKSFFKTNAKSNRV